MHYRALQHLIGFIKNTSTKRIFYSKVLEYPIFKHIDNKIKTIEETIITFSDSSWNDYIDTEEEVQVDI